MITKQKYVEYLVSTPINYTCTNLAEHLEGMSHDAVSDFLKRERLTASHLWELVAGQIEDSPDAYLIIDDSVQDKRYSRSIEMVKLQYSGAEGGLVRGIAVVNLIHTSGEDSDYYPIDFRIYAKEADGKTKNDHFQELLLRAVGDKQIQAKTVLFDSWYGSWQNLKLVHRLGLTFYTTLKANRMVSLSAEDGYSHLDAIDWNDERLRHGIIVKLKKVPFKVRLFKVVAINGDIDWVITNDLDETVITQVAQNANELRWQIEEFHRELKQLTGSAKCQCRKARSQRNHLACCYHAWLSLKVHASLLNKTIYRVHTDLFSVYLRNQLRSPTILLSSQLSESPNKEAMPMRPPELTHQLIYKNPHAYCAWPDIKILQDGEWVLAFCEAMRRPVITHLDPSLLNMLLRSEDGGQSWHGPQVIAGYDFAGMDDPGMVQLSSGVLLVNTARNSFVSLDAADSDAAYARFRRSAGLTWAGSYPVAEGTYVHRSGDGGRTWDGSARVDVSPFVSGYTLRPITELEDGSLLLPCYDESQVPCPSFVVPSYDQGHTWRGARLIAVDDMIGFFEPALLALPGGRVLAMLRTHEEGNHHLYQCHSDDGGRTWSSAQPTPMRGLPPHMLRLQDGRLLCVYGCRWAPFGIRACLSNDEGASWDIDNELILRDDFSNGDLGYPTSVQRPDGSICTAYYGQDGEGVTCIQASSYRIPD